MRILFTTWGWPSHLYAMVPLARACRDAGHEARVATRPGLAGAVRDTGLPAVPVGADINTVAAFRGFVLPPERPVGARPPTGAAAGPDRPPRALRLFADLAENAAGDLLTACRAWRPDLIVHDPTDFAAPIVAAALGVPTVRHLYGLDVAHLLRRFLPALLTPLGERLGVAGVEVAGGPTIDPCPAGLQVPAGYEALPVRHVPYHGRVGGSPPSAASRPRVCVTWGTTMARLGAALFLAGPVARALAGLDADVVVAVTRDQRALLGDLPAGTRVVESTSLSALVPGCAAVVHHGGAGTMLACLLHGVPQLVVPQLPDHALHASRLAGTGAGEALSRGQATAERLRAGVTALLAGPDHRRAAGELAARMRSRRGPAALVGELERVAAR